MCSHVSCSARTCKVLYRFLSLLFSSRTPPPPSENIQLGVYWPITTVIKKKKQKKQLIPGKTVLCGRAYSGRGKGPILFTLLVVRNSFFLGDPIVQD